MFRYSLHGVGKSRILIISLRFGSWRTFRGKVTRLHDKVLTPFLVKDFFSMSSLVI